MLVLGSLQYAPYLRWVNFFSFVIVVLFNFLASTGKISVYSVGQVSALYPTYITPASYAFSIWGVIYALVALFSIFQALPHQQHSKLLWVDIGWLFSLSCLFNVLWIIVFVQGTCSAVWVSTVLIFSILACLLMAHRRAKCWQDGEARSWTEMVVVDVMLSMYSGWLTVACVVNVSVAFVSSGLPNLGWTGEYWCVVMLVVAALLNLGMLVRCSDWCFGFVYTWATLAIAKATPSEKCRTTAYVLGFGVGLVCMVVGIVKIVKRRTTPTLSTGQELEKKEQDDQNSIIISGLTNPTYEPLRMC